MRAIFADGQAQATLLFKQVFRDELREPRRGKRSKRRSSAAQLHLNLDENELGDYGLPDDDDDDDYGDDLTT
ncbi:hypothetical protein KEM52_004623, partial [Ascosphaera acerosa]